MILDLNDDYIIIKKCTDNISIICKRTSFSLNFLWKITKKKCNCFALFNWILKKVVSIGLLFFYHREHRENFRDIAAPKQAYAYLKCCCIINMLLLCYSKCYLDKLSFFCYFSTGIEVYRLMQWGKCDLNIQFKVLKLHRNTGLSGLTYAIWGYVIVGRLLRFSINKTTIGLLFNMMKH